MESTPSAYPALTAESYRENGIRGFTSATETKTKMVRDLSGKPCAINRELLEYLLAHHYTPVLSIPIIDETNTAINSENDDIVGLSSSGRCRSRASSSSSRRPVFSRTRRILRLSSPGSPAANSNNGRAVSHGRIKRKLLAVRRLISQGPIHVTIADGRIEHPVREALNGRGTGIRMKDYIALERKYEFDVYPKREVVIVRGLNARLWDDRGKEYIDCVAGHGWPIWGMPMRPSSKPSANRPRGSSPAAESSSTIPGLSFSKN